MDKDSYWKKIFSSILCRHLKDSIFLTMFKKDFLIRLLAQDASIDSQDPELIKENQDRPKLVLRVKKSEHLKRKVF